MMQESVLLEPRRRVAFGGSLLLLGMILLAIASEYKEFRRADVRGEVVGAHYRVSFVVLSTLAVAVPILAFFATRRPNRVWLSPTDIVIGRTRAAWSDIDSVNWDGRRGGNSLVFHRAKGPPLRLIASMYEGGEEQVLTLLKQYLPAQMLTKVESELRDVELNRSSF
jgi:hypothetical protein